MDYRLLEKQVASLGEEEAWYVPFLANVSALLYETLPDLNWAGFYLLRDGALVLGPFQGKTACIHIAVGRGVCGTAVKEERTVLVPDVHAFPGHIACDSASNSELVIPVRKDGKIVGVLDLDSPKTGRFQAEDAAGLEGVVKVLEERIAF
ncbi:MAG: GAF domain-containing protein [Lachnospiraceae bacterium]|nr:GAF domain-containing protein [Lachnospiraceae bacterium]